MGRPTQGAWQKGDHWPSCLHFLSSCCWFGVATGDDSFTSTSRFPSLTGSSGFPELPQLFGTRLEVREHSTSGTGQLSVSWPFQFNRDIEGVLWLLWLLAQLNLTLEIFLSVYINILPFYQFFSSGEIWFSVLHVFFQTTNAAFWVQMTEEFPCPSWIRLYQKERRQELLG